MRIGPFLCLLLLFGLPRAVAQTMPIDTADLAYRKEVETSHGQHSVALLAKINKIESRKVRREVADRYNEAAADFLKSTRKGVFLPAPAHRKLCNDILQKIVQANPGADFSGLELLVAASDDANAYCMGNGLIAVNLPLFARLDNEYELAFILSHEMAHQLLEHVLKGMVSRAEIGQSETLLAQTKNIAKQRYNRGSMASKLYKQLVYGDRDQSRKTEAQADSLGFVLFSRAYPHVKNQAVHALQILKNLDVPKDSLNLGDYETIFGATHLTFKPEWIAGEVQQYTYQKDKRWNVDSLRTHPDCDQRTAMLRKNFNLEENQKALPPTAEYRALLADWDHAYPFSLFFIEQYGQSLYETFLALKKNPNDAFLRKLVYDNLQKLAQARTTFTTNKYFDTENPSYSDSYNAFLRFLGNLRKTELNLILETYKPNP